MLNLIEKLEIHFVFTRKSDNFSEDEIVDYKDMPELERYILHKLYLIDNEVRKSYKNFDLKVSISNIIKFFKP